MVGVLVPFNLVNVVVTFALERVLAIGYYCEGGKEGLQMVF